VLIRFSDVITDIWFGIIRLCTSPYYVRSGGGRPSTFFV